MIRVTVLSKESQIQSVCNLVSREVRFQIVPGTCQLLTHKRATQTHFSSHSWGIGQYKALFQVCSPQELRWKYWDCQWFGLNSFVTLIIRLQSVCHSFHSKDTIDKYVTRKIHFTFFQWISRSHRLHLQAISQSSNGEGQSQRNCSIGKLFVTQT